jgi:hypothetical protein
MDELMERLERERIDQEIADDLGPGEIWIDDALELERQITAGLRREMTMQIAEEERRRGNMIIAMGVLAFAAAGFLTVIVISLLFFR